MKIKLFRRIVQISTILLIIAVPVLNIKGINIITGSLYSFAIGPLWITDPISGFQAIISTLSADGVLLLSMLIPVTFAFAFGRIFCGWMCPQNTVSELFDYISQKIKVERPINPAPRAWPRYIVMIALLILTPLLGFPVANLISAPGIISVHVTKYFYEGVVGIELSLIGIIVLSEMFILRRIWCNYICPVGGFLGIFRFRKTMKVVYAEDAGHVCGRCMECLRACRLGLNPVDGNIYPLCHNCGDCIVECEKIKNNGKPLSFKF